MQKHLFFFSLLAGLFCIAGMFACARINGDGISQGHLSFVVFDVGQGLAQATIRKDTAVVWDIGDRHSYSKWLSGFHAQGSPYITAIVISHGDMDHKGGLSRLPADARFSGLVITGPYEDTASLRAFAVNWSSRIQFRTVRQGDTLALLPGAYIECLWPPKGPDTDPWVADNFDRNRFSLCIKVTWGATSLLMTGDIDTIAMDKLVKKYLFALRSDIVVVPHHGSRSSLHPLFYGYCLLDNAIISCGAHNPYGHPADEVLRLLAFQMKVAVFDTRYDGHVAVTSNGEYWVRQKHFSTGRYE